MLWYNSLPPIPGNLLKSLPNLPLLAFGFLSLPFLAIGLFSLTQLAEPASYLLFIVIDEHKNHFEHVCTNEIFWRCNIACRQLHTMKRNQWQGKASNGNQGNSFDEVPASVWRALALKMTYIHVDKGASYCHFAVQTYTVQNWRCWRLGCYRAKSSDVSNCFPVVPAKPSTTKAATEPSAKHDNEREILL